MAPECSRATCGDGAQHVELLVAKPGAVLFPEAVTADPKDIGHQRKAADATEEPPLHRLELR